MQDCCINQVTISLRRSPSINGRYLKEWLCRFRKFPGKDVAGGMTASDGGKISRYAERSYCTTLDRYISLLALIPRRRSWITKTFRTWSDDRFQVLVVVEHQNNALRCT